MAATFPLLLLLLLHLVLAPCARAADAVVSRIAFGSCANQSAPQVRDGIMPTSAGRARSLSLTFDEMRL